MKELLFLTVKESKFKFKVLLLSIVAMVGMIISLILGVLFIAPGIEWSGFVGMVLAQISCLAISFFCIKYFINKIMIIYYPDINVDIKQLLTILLSIILIYYLVGTIFTIILFAFMVLAVVLQSIFILCILFIAFLVITYQLAVFYITIGYTIISLLESDEVTYSKVFTCIFNNYKVIRKASSQTLLRVLVYSIVILVIMIVLIPIGNIILAFIAALFNSFGLFIILRTLGLIFLVFLACWIWITCLQYLVKRYSLIKTLLEVE